MLDFSNTDVMGGETIPAETKTIFWNDAEVLGVKTPAMEAILDKPATLLLGQVYGEKDRRNTQDGQWKPTCMTWREWIEGKSGKDAWGFSRHPVSKHKEGACIVLGSSIEGARKAQAMTTMYAMGWDFDSGVSVDYVLKKLLEKKIFALIYTTHSHGKSGIQLKRDDVLRKLNIDRDPTLEEVKNYLRVHDKHQYEESFIESVRIIASKLQVKSGVVIDLETKPFEKFRVIAPLKEPVEITKIANTHSAALALYESKITGFARKVLGCHFDTSCSDVSRVFFTGRHPIGAGGWECIVVQGEPLNFGSIPTMRKADYINERNKASLNVWERAGGVGDSDVVPQCVAPSGASLNDWHRKHKVRFQLADLMESVCPDKTRRTGSEPNGFVTVECPHESDHSSEGGAGCMVGNALDAEKGFWVWTCHHDSCQGRHKLEFLQEALKQGWFDEKLLTDTDSGFVLLPSDDEDEDLIEEAPKDSATRNADLQTRLWQTYESRVKAFTSQTTGPEVTALIKDALKNDADPVTLGRIKKAVVGQGVVSAAGYNDLFKDASKPKRKAKGEATDANETAIVNRWDFHDLCAFGQKQLITSNEKNPALFYYMDELYSLSSVPGKTPRMGMLSEKGFAHHLNNAARFVRSEGEKGDTPRGVAAPLDVVSHLFQSDKGVYPALKAQAVAPYYNADGSLVLEPGYDPKGQIYLTLPPGLVIPDVSENPTTEEVEEAKNLLISDLFGDFPLGGENRKTLLEKTEPGGEGVPALANLLAMTLQPFLRDMIKGDTPIYLADKPEAGTGAGYMIAVATGISSGQAATPLAMPPNDTEFAKVLTSALQTMPAVIWFDNPNHTIKSAELCSAVTSGGTYMARLLGKTALVEVEVRGTWVIAGNNVKGSKEVTRRFVLIDMDAKHPEPGERGVKWLHDDIRSWASENRGRLIWACLTLISNWLAAGKPLFREYELASFEPWSRIMGGILEAAGIKGFLGNREKLKAATADAVQSNETALVRALHDLGNGAGLRAGGTSAFKGRPTVSVRDLLNVADEGDPLLLSGWGYDERGGADGAGIYRSAEKIKTALDKFAARVHSLTVEDGGKDVKKLISFEKFSDTKNGGYVYVQTIKAA